MIGQVIDGRYRIVSHLSDGGMGSVYVAEHVQLNRQVAVKTLRADVADQDTAAKRFEREALAASEIDHPNVVQVLDFGRLDNGEFYYAMELLQGRDFSELLRDEGRLSWDRVRPIARQLVQAFAAAHAHGIVHRDIKPANCFLLTPRPGLAHDHVKVLDFGIAKREHTEAGQELTADTQVVGTAAYMAPEQVLTGKTDPRSDIYSLGIVIYELLGGQPPFHGETAIQTINHHINTPPPPLRRVIGDLPIEVEAFVMRMLTKRPEHRFQTMEEVEAALEDLSGGTGTESLTGLVMPNEAPTAVMMTVGASAPGSSTQGSNKGARVLAIGGVLLALGIAGAVVSLVMKDGGTEEITARAVEDEPEPPPTDLPKESEPEPPPPTGNPFVPNWLSGEISTAGSGVDSRCLEEPLPRLAWTKEAGTLAGTIRADKKAVAEAQVCAWLVDEAAPHELTSSPRCTVVGNAKGRYEIGGLSPGHYELSTFAPGYLPKRKLPVCVWPGEKTRKVDVTLEQGGVDLRGRVRDSQGRAVSGAYVTVAKGARTLAVTDLQGRFLLWVEDGPQVLMAWANGYTHAKRAGIAGEDSFDIELERDAVVTGSVVLGPDKEGVPGVEIEASYRSRPGQEIAVGLSSYTDEKGEFRIAGLKPGEVWITAQVPDAPEEVRNLELAPGASSRVVIELVEPEPEPETILEAGSETGDTGETGAGTETGVEADEPETPVQLPTVKVRFVAGKLKWAELKISGQKRGFAEPARTLTLPVGIHRVHYRQNGAWKYLGTIELERGKAYEARLSRNTITLKEKS